MHCIYDFAIGRMCASKLKISIGELNLKAISFFTNLICSSLSWVKALKNRVGVLPFSIAIKSYNKQFENKPIKKMNDLENASQQEKKLLLFSRFKN